MKFINGLLLAVSFVASSSAIAKIETHQYENKTDVSTMQMIREIGPRLEQIDSVKFTLKRDENRIVSLEKAEYNFSAANKLVVTNFSKMDDYTYRAIVNNPWVFRQGLLEVHFPHFYGDEAHAYSRFHIVENQSFNDAPAESFGRMYWELPTELKDTTPLIILDVTSTYYLDKRLTLKLKDRLDNFAFQIEAFWHGYGTETLKIGSPYPDAIPVGVNLETIEHPDGRKDVNISIKFKDEFGNIHNTPFEDIHGHLETVFMDVPPKI